MIASLKKFGKFIILVRCVLLLAGCGDSEVKGGFAPDLSHWDKQEEQLLKSNRYDMGFISRGTSYSCIMAGQNDFFIPLTLAKGMQVGELSDFQYNENEMPCFILSIWYSETENVTFYFFDDFKYVGYVEGDSWQNATYDMPKYELLNGQDMKLLFQNYKFYFTYDELDKVNAVVEDFMQKYPDLLSAILDAEILVESPDSDGEDDFYRFQPLDYSIFWKDYRFEYVALDVDVSNKLSNERFFTETLTVNTKNESYRYTFKVQEMSDGDYQLSYVTVSKI